MHNTQVLFKAVQKDSDNSTIQIEEKRLYQFKDVLIHCFARYHEQSAEVDHDQKTEWHSRDSLHAIKCSNESETQAIRDLDVRSTNRSSSHSVRLWNQICDLHAKLRHHRSIWSSLTRQTSAYAENEKNIELHNRMNTQLSKESRDIANIRRTNEWHARDERRHIAEFLISSILFLFFNASLIKKCEALKIKIEVLDFVNDINILVYNRFTEEICRTLSKAHDVCAKWVHTHDATFASEKYEFTHFTRKSRRFDMMTSIQIENSVIKSKSDV